MPSIDFASGLLGSYFDTVAQERDRKDRNALAAADFLLKSGRLKDYNDLLPIIGELGEPGISVKGKGGGKGSSSGKGGAISHHDVLGALINPILQAQQQSSGAATAQGSGGGDANAGPWPLAGTPGAAPQPTGATSPATAGQPAPASAQASRGPLFTEDEMVARGNTARDRERAANFTTFQQQQTSNLDTYKQQQIAETQRQIAVEKAKYRNVSWAPGVVAGKDVGAEADADTLGNPIDRTGGSYRTRVLPNGDREYLPVSAAPKSATPAQAGSFADFIKRRQDESGTKLDSKGVLSALTEYQRANLKMTPGERQAMAKDLATFRAGIGTPEAEDISALAQTAKIGDKSTPYFDISTSKDKAKASRDAIRQGIIPVTTKQADQLADATSASQNLTGFLDQIKSKLPKDAQDRPLTGLTNVYLGQLFQTDADLASAAAWDVTVVPLLRGLRDSGRLTNVHMKMAFAARPQITDDVATAVKKVAILNTVLTNSANAILTRGVNQGAGASPAARPKTDTPAPGNVVTLLKGKKAGHYKLNDGSEWDVLSSGAVVGGARR